MPEHDGCELWVLQCDHGVDAVENRCANLAYGESSRASMRPRRGCRGEHLTRDPELRSVTTLQCDHGVDAVENRDPIVIRHIARRASMRPRRGCRGERQTRQSYQLLFLCFNATTAWMPRRTVGVLIPVIAASYTSLCEQWFLQACRRFARGWGLERKCVCRKPFGSARGFDMEKMPVLPSCQRATATWR